MVRDALIVRRYDYIALTGLLGGGARNCRHAFEQSLPRDHEQRFARQAGRAIARGNDYQISRRGYRRRGRFRQVPP
jgi:hypothetical protein